MKLPTLILCGAALAGIASGALAGEDSTHRLHGVGPAWYEIKDGLRKLAAGDPDELAPTARAPARASASAMSP